MGFNFERLNELANDRSNEVIKKAEELERNQKWLHMSRMIALAIRYHLRKEGIKQNVFADMLGVSPAYVGKLLKGNENLTLETISRIQDILGKDLISIHRPYEYNISVLSYNIENFHFKEENRGYSATTDVKMNSFSVANDAA